MSEEDRAYMLRYVSCTIALQGGMTEVTRCIISAQFVIDPALVDVIASWVMSQEVEDNKLPDDQRLAEPPDHWVQHAYEYVTQADLDEIEQSSSAGWPVAARTKQASRKSTSQPAKRIKISSTRRHLGPNQGAAYEAELEEPYQHRNLPPRQTIDMGRCHPTTTHMESNKGGRPDKVDKDGAEMLQTHVQVAIENVLSIMETRAGNLPDYGFVAQIVFNIINENFAHYSQQPQQATISEKLFQETLATMSWSGRLTTAFDRESRTLLIVNFLPNDAAEGLRIAHMYESHGDKDQKTHAKWFFYLYGEQQRTLATRQRDSDSSEETIHERNFRARQQEYQRDVFKTSSFNSPSVQMRRRLHKITRPCLSKTPVVDRSRVASTSTSSSTEPIGPRFLIQTPQDEGTRPRATSERNRTDLTMAQRQAEREVPDLQSREFRGWREEALKDHRKTPDQQSVRLRIDSLRLSEITEEEEPGDE